MSDETVRLGPIDLSRESDFSLGVLQVCPSTREVVRDGQRETLEPKSMQVLIALHQAKGRVVSRDDLIARCWDGRIVSDDAINRVIGRLRRLSEDGAIFTIEAIAKVGYRFQLPAGNDESSAASQPMASDTQSILPAPANSSEPASLLVRYRLAAAGAVLLAIAGVAAWLLWPSPHWTVESSRPFVSTLALEGEPAFSPDGKMLAYISGPDAVSEKIYVRNLAGGDAIKITSDAHSDHSPSWSSDGSHIAYVTQNPGEPCRIMVAAVPAGEAREVGRCRRVGRSTVSWQPNSSFLYYQDESENGELGIFRLDLDSGARLNIVKGDIRNNLYISPDGKSLAYLVDHMSVNSQLVVRDLTSGNERILGNVRRSSMFVWGNSEAWSADSKTVFATSSRGSGSEIIAFPVDGSPSYRVYASATGTSRLSASAGGILAIQSHLDRTNLARASPAPIAQPDIIDRVGGITSSPTFAPDGTLAFISDRSGTNAIWIKKPGAVPVQIFDAGFAALRGLNFSPDGTRLAITITPITKLDGVTVKVLSADGASVASFDVPGFSPLTWTPDGKGLIVWDNSSRRDIRVDVANPSHRIPVAPPDWRTVAIRNDGIFATRADNPGIWRIDNGIRLLNGKYPGGYAYPITFLGDDVLIPDFGAAGGARILAQPVGGGPDRVLAYAPGAEALVYQSRMVVNPKTGEIIYVATVLSDTNIDLLTLARH
jgi:Tol biopolymer transport system component/DNA-binding winged helix-turn-helix (wHTH) protein